MAGDFNEPLIEEDKYGGRGVHVNRSLAFKDYLDSCNMVDMGFFDLRYTWTNKRDLNNLILERIDRFFMNSDWSINLTRPFKFQEFWLFDTSFPNVISRSWNRGGDLAECINTFSKDASEWNKTHFGNVHHKKRRVITIIYGVQKALVVHPSTDLINLEKQLHQELDLLLDQERNLWALKSRINWMIQGEYIFLPRVYSCKKKEKPHCSSTPPFMMKVAIGSLV
ncbi:uncharacterized protein LOC111994165 [Quercus suber]|uniref:uncharacterized protein LOC111994165 n=1 Tax=Quercus suber TaxID=58331 RepID=UPI000CE22326|nr:uncharacterized protein LOC111994165 [Quercus suber]